MKIKKNSTICCLGDSITDQGFWLHDMINYLAVNAPDEHIRLYNCGIGGSTVERAMYYFADELLWAKPDYVMLRFGINDINRELYHNESENDLTVPAERKLFINKYKKYLRELAELITGLGIKVIFVNGYVESLHRPDGCCGAVKKAYDELCEYNRILAKEFDDGSGNIIDISDKLWSEEERFYSEGKSLLRADGVHPNRIGHAVLAAETLKAMGYTENISVDGMLSRTLLNSGRFDVEKRLRAVSYIKWGMYHPLKSKSVDFDELSSLYDTAEEWLKFNIRSYQNHCGELDTLRKILIAKTEAPSEEIIPEAEKIMAYYADTFLK